MPAGVVKLTASGVVQESGAPQRLYNIEIDSGGTGGIVQLINGIVATAEIHLQAAGTASQVATPTNFPAAGMYFPKGLFVSMNANCNAVYCEVEQVATI